LKKKYERKDDPFVQEDEFEDEIDSVLKDDYYEPAMDKIKPEDTLNFRLLQQWKQGH